MTKEYRNMGLAEIHNGFGWVVRGKAGTYPLSVALDYMDEKFEKMKNCQNCKHFDLVCGHPENAKKYKNYCCELWEFKE